MPQISITRPSSKKHYHVVAAVVQRPDGRTLCCQRGQTRFAYTSYKWEFPGGKIEPGETPEAALRREMREEMDFDVVPQHELITVHHDYPDFLITMTAFICRPCSDYQLNEHVAACWLLPEELSQLDWAAADVEVWKKVAEGE